jgi:hypothetical protein
MYLTSEKIHFVNYLIRWFANNGNGVNGFNNGRWRRAKFNICAHNGLMFWLYSKKLQSPANVIPAVLFQLTFVSDEVLPPELSTNFTFGETAYTLYTNSFLNFGQVSHFLFAILESSMVNLVRVNLVSRCPHVTVHCVILRSVWTVIKQKNYSLLLSLITTSSFFISRPQLNAPKHHQISLTDALIFS